MPSCKLQSSYIERLLKNGTIVKYGPTKLIVIYSRLQSLICKKFAIEVLPPTILPRKAHINQPPNPYKLNLPNPLQMPSSKLPRLAPSLLPLVFPTKAMEG